MPAGIVNEKCDARNPCAVGTLPGRCDPPGNYIGASELSRSMTYTARLKEVHMLDTARPDLVYGVQILGGAGRLENIG